jgi:hypothetical protein
MRSTTLGHGFDTLIKEDDVPASQSEFVLNKIPLTLKTFKVDIKAEI